MARLGMGRQCGMSSSGMACPMSLRQARQGPLQWSGRFVLDCRTVQSGRGALQRRGGAWGVSPERVGMVCRNERGKSGVLQRFGLSVSAVTPDQFPLPNLGEHP